MKLKAKFHEKVGNVKTLGKLESRPRKEMSSEPKLTKNFKMKS